MLSVRPSFRFSLIYRVKLEVEPMNLPSSYSAKTRLCCKLLRSQWGILARFDEEAKENHARRIKKRDADNAPEKEPWQGVGQRAAMVDGDRISGHA